MTTDLDILKIAHALHQVQPAVRADVLAAVFAWFRDPELLHIVPGRRRRLYELLAELQWLGHGTLYIL